MTNKQAVALVVATIVLIAVAIVSFRRSSEPDIMGPKESTKSRLRTLAGSFLDYYSKIGRWPDPINWENELKPYFNTGKAGQGIHPVQDAWGNKVKYEVLEQAGAVERRLYSFGPNGIDESGANDDILMSLYDPEKPGR